jgi:4-amino-4-deoxy-L-arabinose transferase-like glycosyltransferase
MSRRSLRLLPLLFLALVTLFGLSYAPFWNPDEGRYVAASYEMAYSLDEKPTDWLVPHLNTITRLNKPPLIYLTTASSFKIFGPSEWSGRLPSALAALLVLFILYFWGRRAISEKAGLGAALVWATSVFPAAMGRTANTDMMLSASMFLVGFGVFFAIEGRRKLLFGIIAGVGMGLALLSKGPVGMALPLIAAFLYLTLSCSWKRAPWGAMGIAFVTALVIALPWYLAVEARRPGYIYHFVFVENFGRFSSDQEFHDKTSPLFYVPILIGGLLPWTAFLVPTFSRWRESADIGTKTHLFAAIWGIFIVAFFSISGTKLISYILPAFPAFALLIGITISHWEKIGRGWRNVAVALTLILNLGLIVAVSGYPKKDKQTKEWEIASGVLLDGKIFEREKGLPWVYLITGVMAGGSALLLIANRRPNGKTLLVAQGATSGGVLLLLLGLAGEISKYEDGSGVLVPLRSVIQKEDRIAGYRTFLPAAMFYFERPITWFHFKNTSGLAKSELEVSPYFYMMDESEGEKSTKDATDLLNWERQDSGRIIIITRGFIDDNLKHQYDFWGRNNDFFIYSNRPKPENFNLNRTSPGKLHEPEVHGVPKKADMNEPSE